MVLVDQQESGPWAKMELTAGRAAQQGAWQGALGSRFSQLKVRADYISMSGR